MKLQRFNILIGLLVLLPLCMTAQWSPKRSPIKTQWSELMDPANPLPEYPRPQMVRKDWKNLNGSWEYKQGLPGDELPHKQTLAGKIVVPFPVQSTLSGVVKHMERMWYRKTFSIPQNWDGKRLLLHFGAIDWESEVYINGTSLGVHQGGYDAFHLDITDHLISGGEQELIVRVYDPTRDYGQPRGKQTTAPGGAMYYPVTGIWQTVWLEPVSNNYIEKLKLVPDIDNGYLKMTVVSQESSNLNAIIELKDGETVVATTEHKVNEEFAIPVPNAKLWSPDSPFLYDLNIVLKDDNAGVDSLTSYFGMRKISRSGGIAPQLMLNNEFVFQMGPLDQGYWPEGIYTAPTDAALKYDIEVTKALGFNMTRKHLKVEPLRWYYWADKIGLLVWQDMPSANSYDTPNGVTTDEVAHEKEMKYMIDDLMNCPSIVMWVLFNEGCGQFDTKGRVDLVEALDPSRLVDQGSGGMVATPKSAGDVIDAHRYPNPLCETQPYQASVSGEYGGIFYKVPNHQWGTTGLNPDHARSEEELVSTYSSLADQVIYYKTNTNLSAAIYTQITDVETEINGLITYDRIPKTDVDKLKAINQRIIYGEIASTEALIPTSKINGQTWQYTINEPSQDWNKTTFDDSSWNTGTGGFGVQGTPGAIVRTNWNTTGGIWLRRKFTLENITREDLSSIALSLHHDDECDVYINGIHTGRFGGFTTEYEMMYLRKECRDVLRLTGENTLAIHCVQHGGGQFIDAGLVRLRHSETSDVKENKTREAFSIYPNPMGVSGMLNVEMGPNHASFDKIGVWAMNGSQLCSQAINGQRSFVLDLSDNQLSSGMYLVLAEGKENTSMPQKLIVY